MVRTMGTAPSTNAISILAINIAEGEVWDRRSYLASEENREKEDRSFQGHKIPRIAETILDDYGEGGMKPLRARSL